MNKKVYWKVKKGCLKLVNNITDHQINVWENICGENKYGFIYISCYDGNLSYMPYDPESIKFYEREKIKYCGEIGIKQNRRLKLKQINESILES